MTTLRFSVGANYFLFFFGGVDSILERFRCPESKQGDTYSREANRKSVNKRLPVCFRSMYCNKQLSSAKSDWKTQRYPANISATLQFGYENVWFLVSCKLSWMISYGVSKRFRKTLRKETFLQHFDNLWGTLPKPFDNLSSTSSQPSAKLSCTLWMNGQNCQYYKLIYDHMLTFLYFFFMK